MDRRVVDVVKYNHGEKSRLEDDPRLMKMLEYYIV